ncbi:phage tail tape measure protein [Dietzia sp. CQ4]|uniref:phage tail tape measure protein n=1 Tax=Dietzia sp. (strain CQ4) TaxID=370437 RepID=UPI0015FDA911|nr:phage tail tape measure protein [Dietzia sp. CQ4]MBB1033401.1 phage tail tape measure protein [Dietzia sp. CQ4]
MSAIGYAVLPMTVSMKGIGQTLARDFTAPAAAAGRKAADDLGKSMVAGARTSGEAAKRASRELEAAVATAEKYVTKAGDAAEKAQNKVADATGKVRVAQEQYNAALTSGDPVKLAQAEERLESARRRQSEATTDAERKSRDLTDAQSALETAQARSARAALDQSEAVGRSRLSAEEAAQASRDLEGAQKALEVGLLAVGVAAVATAGYLFKLGSDFQDMTKTIRVGTGATGDDLDGLRESALAVGREVPASFGDVGTALADINTALGHTGQPLEDLTKQFLNLEGITGIAAASSIPAVTRAFGDWNIAADEQGAIMDRLFRASQNTGSGVDLLAQRIVQFGAPMRGMGFDLDETTALLGLFEKTGVNTELVMGSMRQALSLFAREGKSAPEALREVTDEIKNMEDPTKAASRAMEIFGARAGADMADTIRGGKFEIEELLDAMRNGSDTINGVAEETRSLSDMMAIFKNNVLAELEPLATAAFGALLAGGEWVVANVIPALQGLAEWAGANKDLLIGLSIVVGSMVGGLALARTGLILFTTAQRIWNVVTLLSETGVRKLNAAMKANLFGIIAGAVIGVVAALTWFFTQTETGQAIWAGFMDVLRSGWEWLSGIFMPIWDALVDKVTAVVETVKTAWSELTTAFQGGDDGYGALAAIIGEDAAEWAVNTISYVKSAWGELTAAFTGGDDGYGALASIFGEQGAEWIVTAVATVSEALQVAGELLGTLWSTATELGATLGGAIWEIARSLFSALVEVGSALFEAFREIGTAVWELFQALSPVLLPVLKVVAAVIGVTLYVAIKGIIGALKLVATVVGALAQAMSWFSTNVLTPLIGVLGQFASALIGQIAGALRTVVEWAGKVISFVGDMGSKIIGVFTSAKTWLFDTGRDIVRGLLEGIKSLAGTVGSYFLDLLPNWIRKPFEKALGIQSPSRVFAGYGADIGAGLVHGVQGMAGQVADAARGLAETAATAAGEVQIAFNGGDDGFGALASLAGDDLARAAANTAADVGGATRTAGAAATELGTAFTGGDDGYAATGEFLGEDAARTALDVSAQIGSAFTAVGEGVDGAKTALFDPAVAGMQQSLLDYGQVAQDQMNGVVVPVMNQAGAGIADAKARLFDPAHAGLQAAVTQTGAATQAAMLGTALPSMQTAGTGILAVQTGTVDPALANMRGALWNTAGAFATGTTAINTEFSKVREGVAAPVRFTIGPVFNDGLVSMWNGVSDMVGLKKMTPHPINFWAGGVLPGYTPGRDPFTFIDPRTGMSIGLSGGEAIMRPEWTQAIGPAGVERMNHVARTEGATGVNRMLEHRHLGGFNSGGIVGSMEAFVGKHWPSLLQNGRAFSGLRFTDNGYHSKGMAADFSNGGNAGTPEMKALANVIYRNFAGQTLELIHWPLAGFQNLWHGRPHNYSAGTNEQHRNHVHWALPAPLQAAGVALDLSGGAVEIDPRQIVESMIGDDLKRVKDLAHGFKGAGGMVDAVPGKVHDTMVKPMLDTLVKAFEEFGGDPGGADVQRWRPLAMQALARMGYNPALHIEAMLKQIEYESSGEPNSINLWDSNALRGTPSGGLLHVIEPTYRRVRAAYPDAFKGLPDDRMHPLTNLTAGVGAVKMDWGGPAGRWPTKLGYDQGGFLPPTPGGFGTFFNHTKAPEPVFTADQWALLERQLGLNVDLVEELRRMVLVINRDDDDRDELAAQAVYDVFGREPIGPDLHKVLHAGPRAWSETAAHLEHIAATGEYLQNEWFAESSQLAEAARAVNRGQVGFEKWAAASEDHGRMGSPEEFAQHYGQQVGAELLDGALGLVGLDGLIGGTWKQSIRDVADAGGWELPGFGPTPLLDDDGRVLGTRLERVEAAVAESTEAATTEAAVAVAGAKEAPRQPITIVGDSIPADQVEELLGRIEGVEFDITRMKGERASITTRKVLA